MDAKNLGKNVNKAVERMINDANTAKYVVIALCVLLIMMMLFWIYSKSTLDERNCSNMKKLYADVAKIRTINPENAEFKHNLRDYYIKTAYNACSPGQFKNDFVNICALKSIIGQGARCLDFEIYSLNDEPVVATSSVENYTIKETYNSVSWSDVCKTINDYAFSSGTCPNAGDPLIIHMRLMSNNKPMYTKMAKIFENTLSDRLLGPKYSYENHGKNLGIEPIANLMGKVIIIADRSNAMFEDTDVDEYVNLASNSIFMRGLRYTEGVKYAPDMNELIDFNKKNMSIVFPDLSESDINYAFSLTKAAGCQFSAMSFQNFDTQMEYYDVFFDGQGTAFVLKPEALRYIPVTVPPPTAANPKYSYEERTTKTDYYSMTI